MSSRQVQTTEKDDAWSMASFDFCSFDATTQATMNEMSTSTSETSQAYVMSRLGLRIRQHIERLKHSVKSVLAGRGSRQRQQGQSQR